MIQVVVSLVQQRGKGDNMVVSVVIPSSSINSTQVLESCIKIILQKIHYQRPLLKLNHIFLINLAVVKGGLQTVLSLDV